MSEKIQHTAARLQQKMSARYDDGLFHKHDKNHLQYRKHCRSHPVQASENEQENLGATGLIRELNLKKMRTRPNKGQIH